jgi:hypothetical protein
MRCVLAVLVLASCLNFSPIAEASICDSNVGQHLHQTGMLIADLKERGLSRHAPRSISRERSGFAGAAEYAEEMRNLLGPDRYGS